MIKTIEELNQVITLIGREYSFKNPALVGQILRDHYGVYSVKSLFNLKLCKILGKSQTEYELGQQKDKLENLKNHLLKHRKDLRVKRLTHSVIAKIANLDRQLKVNNERINRTNHRTI